MDDIISSFRVRDETGRIVCSGRAVFIQAEAFKTDAQAGRIPEKSTRVLPETTEEAEAFIDQDGMKAAKKEKPQDL